ncbi:RNA ligase family protein [Plantactinospora sp. WMMB782]|uniref:RNA ligase family protein n=1 Tax=Plantactinospora sp. WMMB782 TaxID=3404121 RepID=UPI003B9532EC
MPARPVVPQSCRNHRRGPEGRSRRIVSLPDRSYLIGSREELLYARGDLIGNPALGIVDALRPIADRLPPVDGDAVVVHHLEVYGGRVTAASKHYTGSRAVGARLFDVLVLSDYAELLEWPAERISRWRESAGQPFVAEAELLARAEAAGLSTVPRLDVLEAAELPTDLEKIHRPLGDYLPATTVALDGTPGRAEGIVLRTETRSVIAKARFQDNERTLKRRRTGR